MPVTQIDLIRSLLYFAVYSDGSVPLPKTAMSDDLLAAVNNAERILDADYEDVFNEQQRRLAAFI